ncbi:MAG: hypothetical protein GF333_00645 [Candidatus Omnitrophica bacterium]|nr:hypothetical protein [Candidatus Omnitrophota bacterium]
MKSEPKKKFDLYQYLRILVRRKWFFLVPCAVLFIAFTVSSFFFPKKYEARAVILIEEQKVVNPLLQNLAVSRSVGERLNALHAEIVSWPRLYQLVERLGLNKNIQTPLELERLIFSIRKNIGLQMRSNEIVIISYKGEDPKSTQTVVNTLCDILIQRNVSSQVEDTESAIDFINRQLEIYKERLNESESALREFREIYGMQMVQMLRQEQAPRGDTIATTGSETGSPKTSLYLINQEIANVEADLVMARVECTEAHPRVKNLKRKIQELKEKRKFHVGELAEEAGVNPDAYVNIADSLPRQQEELARLTRDRAINEKIYGMLLERLETARITERLDNSENKTKFRIVDPARLPLVPTEPKKWQFALMGLFLGGMMGFGCVYFLDFTDTSFQNEDELKDLFGYPVLGNISKMVTDDDLNRRTKFVMKVIPLILLATAGLIILIATVGKPMFS